MPNWSSGKLKVRGKVKNIERILNESVNQYEYKHLDGKGKDTKIEKPPIDLRDCYEVDLIASSKPESYTRWFYIEKTARAFIEPGCYSIHHLVNGEIGVCFDFHQAWNITPDNFDDISDKYDLDIKIETTECGMCYTERYEKLRGQESTYDCPEYTNWFWDVYDPDLGG